MNINLWIKLKLNRILPPIMKALRRSGKNSVKAYKENKKWYISDFNGYSKDANELVDGIPELIEHFVGNQASKVVIAYFDHPFENSKKLSLVSTDEFGTWYEYIDDREVPHMGWLCPVFFWYFKEPPQILFVTIRAI